VITNKKNRNNCRKPNIWPKTRHRQTMISIAKHRMLMMNNICLNQKSEMN